MAEFKLGRIRFVWQGPWTPGQTYAIDDVISKGGKSYICTVNHIAQADFVNDLSAQPSKWNIVADGTTWRGDWTANTLYNAGDEVKYGGVVYICTLGHTSAGVSPVTINVTGALPNAGKVTLSFDAVSPAPFPIGSEITVTNVNTSGSEYNGTYIVTASTTSSVTYTNATTDIYVSGGSIYSFGGLEATMDRWQTFAESFNWTGNWDTSTRYKLNDFVQYGGFVYLCTVPHVSASLEANGLEADQNKWQIFNQGITYLGEWSGDDIRYKLNDVVKYGADVWICTEFHTSSTTFDDTKWSIMVSGFQFENSWNNSTVYQVGDTVTYGGYTYIAKTNHTNKQPTTNASDWDVFTTGFNFRSEYSDATAYKIGDTVREHGYTYVAIADSTGQDPINEDYWSRLNTGFYWTNNPQTYGAVAGTNVTGTGSNARFDIIRSGTVYNVTISSGGEGVGYATGNIIKILGSSLGGITPANDLIITVGDVSGGAIDTFTWSGRSVTWTVGTVYVLGDVVLFGGNSYICVTPHTATTLDRPDNDVSAAYWNVLTIGSEINVLTTPGDMLYYGPNGPTRLPVGVDGQILRSTDGFPAWANYGLINNLVYVGPLGKDEPAPASGLTIDKPWKTVRYANKQIEDGYRNPNARDLLQKNKQFLIKEINNFLLYTYQVTVTGFSTGTYQFACVSTSGLIENMPISFSGTALGGVTLGTTYYVKSIVDDTHFTISATRTGVTYIPTGSATGTMKGALVYSQSSTERDTGYIIDAVIYDLSRGGTWKTVRAGEKYFTTAGNQYITTMTGYLVPNFVAAHVYLKTLFAAILSNTYPTYSYQSLTGVATGLRAIQNIDATLIAETGALAYIDSLVDIISNALTQGSATALPIAIQPNTTINIKTGTYNEVLPIYMAENTALVGDELRTSVVQPAPANPLLANDKLKTISALNRISALIPSLVGNTTITPTAGNTEPQVYLGFADYVTTPAATSTTANMAVISNIVNKGLTAVPSFTITDPSAITADFFNARRLLVANKAFLVAEISAWINVQITNSTPPFVGFTYGGVGQTSCERDVGYIVDAIRYDLTYGGNLETSVAARSYYSYGIFVETGEKDQALAVQSYLKSIIDNIVSGVSFTKSSGNALTQDTSGTLPVGTDPATFAQARIQEIYDTIDTGTTPTTIEPVTTFVSSSLLAADKLLQYKKAEIQNSAVQFVQANYPTLNFNISTCSRDVGYIVDALRYDLMFGSNFRSVKAGMAYYQAQAAVVVGAQKSAQLALLNFLSTLVSNQLSNALDFGITQNLLTMYDVVNTGLTAVPAFTLTDPSPYDTGFFNARRLLIANKSFIIDEVSTWILAQIAGNIAPFVGFTYAGIGRDKCERDVGYIIDALRYDLTYGGNLETSAAARSYYSYGIFVETGEKDQALAVQARIKNIIDNIVTGDNAGWTKTTAATQDVSGTAGSIQSAIFCQDRIQEIYDTINTGLEPVVVYPNTSQVSAKLQAASAAIQAKKSFVQAHVVDWVQTKYPALSFDAATCSRDVGYILDALCYDLMFGSNFRSIKAAMAYYQAQAAAVLGPQKSAQLGMIYELINVVTNITNGETGSIGSTAAVEKVKAAAKITYDVLAGGFTQIPSLVLTTPTNYNTSLFVDTAYASSGNTTGSTLSYGDSNAQIVQNYAFIKAEISAYLAYVPNGYSTVWSALGATGQAACLRDVGYILDAVRYDMTYGGNKQSLIAGSAYYSNFQLVVQSSEKVATAAAFTYLKAIISQVARKVTVTATSGNVTPQVTIGTVGAGGVYAAAFAQDRVQDVIDWFNNGTANAAIEPATSWCDTELLSSFTAIQAKRSEIASDATVWIKKFFQSVSFDATLSTRDSGLVVDAICYDMLLGTNFNSIKAGMAYYRALASSQNVISTEKEACLGAINYIRQKTALIAANGAATMAQKIISDVVTHIPGGATPIGFVWPNPSNIDSGYAGAATLIYDNRAFIQAEIRAYLAQYTTGGFDWIALGTERQASCIRDTGYLVDALVYDLKYGGTYASKQAAAAYYSFGTLEILSAEKAATLAAYGYLKTLVQAIATDTVASSPSPYQATVTQTRADALQTIGSAGSATAVGALVDIITNYIDLGPTIGTTTITVTAVATLNTFTCSSHGLKAGDIIIPQTTPGVGIGGNGLVSGTIYYVASTGLTSSQFQLSSTWGGTALATFTNGTGLTLALEKTSLPVTSQVSASLLATFTTLNGVKSTLQSQVTSYINTNYPTLVYSTTTCLRDVGYIIDAVGYDMMLGGNFQTVKAALSYYRAQSAKVIGIQKAATVASFRYLKTIMMSTVSSNATAKAAVKSLMTTLIAIVKDGQNESVDVMGTMTYNNNLGVIKGVEILRANTKFLANEATAWIDSQYGGIVSSTLVGNIIETNSAHNLIVGDPVKFTGTLGTSTLQPGTVYYVLATPSSTQFTLAASATSSVEVTVVADLTPTLVAHYGYDKTSCQRDMTEYVLALVQDLQYPGNYKSMRAATLYINAVEGSQRSDMFYVRNACGIRNMTLNGLNGELTEVNDYGTKRPTAGAYSSLCPGFGPNDENSWVTFRSCYCQNVSLFGTGCTGMKIDGALHAGGNRSIVANDYTTILSDGIGVWCTGSQSLTELVSVFCYYSYSGYLAELGGRIRATNGNSSYGVYGVIAEGTDSTEIPLYASLDNRASPATVGNVVTDGTNKVLRFEYGNAGGRYTNYNPAISGAGINATAIGDEFRDDAVFETRLIDLNDGNGFGGKDYTTAINAAQQGDLVSITLSATDTALSTAYPGARVHVTAGQGVGQYANILDYSNGTKIAKVYKDSFTTLTVTATSTTNNLLTVASTATLYTGMPIYLTGTMTGTGGATGLTANTAYYVNSANFSATQFQVSTTPGGAGSAVTISNNVTGLTIGVLAAGWDHVIPGTALTDPLDLTTTYIIEPKINYSAPGYTATARTLSASTTWGQVKYSDGRFVATATGGTATSYSTDGKTWEAGGALPSSAVWTEPVFGGGSGATATATVGGLGGSGAVLIAVLGKANTTGAAGADQVASVTIVNGGTGYTSPPTIVFTPVSGGSNAKAVCTVLNGTITSISTNSNDGGSFGSGYLVAPTVSAATDRVTVIVVNSWGNHYLVPPTVTMTGGGASSQATATAGISNNGVYTIEVTDGGTGYTSAPTVTITDTTAAFATIASGGTATSFLLASSAATTAWTSGGVLPSGNHVAMAYGNGVYAAVGSTATASSTAALASAWTSRTMVTTTGTWSDITYAAGIFLAIATGATSTAYSVNGSSWTAGGALPASTTWTSVTYGNGRFVALAVTGRVAYSLDMGATWTQTPTSTGTTTSVLSSTYTWKKVRYGQGLFFAVATGTNVCATSPDGINWTVRAMSSSSAWNGIAFGNPNNDGQWVAVSATSGQIAMSAKTGAQALGRMKATAGTLLEVRMIEPGSGYPYGTISATTVTTNVITVDNTTNLVDSQPIEFTGLDAYGLTTNTTYYVIGSTIVTDTSFKVSATPGSSTAVLITSGTALAGTYRAAPVTTQTDPNKTVTAPLRTRTGDGAIANPTFTNRGTLNTTATALITGDGNAEYYQATNFISVRNLFAIPQAGSNVVFNSIPGAYYKLVTISNILAMPADGAGNYTAVFQLSPALTVQNAPAHLDRITTTIKYSQTRLTGHDFLYIGTGNKAQTNYPFVDPSQSSIAAQTLGTNGGRVFFTSTDQDGNFNVGNLFGVQQATGTATLNANAFNLSGLQSLQLSGLSLGVGSATITQFSTDPYFTANSDNVLPTQRAIKSYITAQIGGGLSQLNVNTLTAGVVYIANNSISTTSGGQLNITAKMNFLGGIDGAPVALGFFMQR